MGNGYFHVCFLVRDLDAAIVRLQELFQIEFAPPVVSSPAKTWHGRTVQEEVRLSYSRTLPYIELIEGHESGYFSLENGEGFHHIGVWSPDYGSDEWNERFSGLDIEAVVHAGPDDAAYALVSPEQLHGIRLEICDERGRYPLEQWLADPGSRPT